jgi:hypothetical protein
MAAAGRATIAAACVAWALALATTALAWMSPNPKQDDGANPSISATGAMSIDSSRAEAAILNEPALAPGTPAAGTVTIRNHGKPGYLVLSRRNLVETPAAGGAVVGEAIRLTIRDLDEGREGVVYSGPLAAMPSLRLGLLRPAEKRRFRFFALLPEPGRVDNTLMSAGVRLDYRWRIKPTHP